MDVHSNSAPRLVVAGLSGDSGKTVVSLGLLLLARQAGLSTAAFKKGPDYIDAAWLSWAAGIAARNLDTYLMGRETTTRSFLDHAFADGLNLVEGNRGLFDGLDAFGTHSTAELAKLLSAPVLLVVNAAKVTHTIAALVLGCQKLDPGVRIGGVILNRVAGCRHETVLRESVESVCGIPVLGVLPRVEPSTLLPGRHLGLVTPQEHGRLSKLPAKLLAWIQGRLDLERILELARSAPPLIQPVASVPRLEDGRGLKIGYLKDSAFTFYYPENLELLEKSGAELDPVSALTASTLPHGLDALYIGGGFPETHAAALSRNGSLLESIRHHALGGLPIYAECGGLMLLSQAIRWKGIRSPMAGVLPFETEVCHTPQGHGYVELVVDRPNLYYPEGTTIRGHEFHYSKIVPTGNLPPTACAVQRGTGTFGGRDAVVVGNVWASYTHVHALATQEWAQGLIAAALRHGTTNRRMEPQASVEIKSRSVGR
jgi:cobyrinic acid a,c-diamide synthase